MSNRLTEDSRCQQTTADYMRDALGWESVYAYNAETFGQEGTLGRKDDRGRDRRVIILNIKYSG